jgi:hypothetical protein
MSRSVIEGAESSLLGRLIPLLELISPPTVKHPDRAIVDQHLVPRLNLADERLVRDGEHGLHRAPMSGGRTRAREGQIEIALEDDILPGLDADRAAAGRVWLTDARRDLPDADLGTLQVTQAGDGEVHLLCHNAHGRKTAGVGREVAVREIEAEDAHTTEDQPLHHFG